MSKKTKKKNKPESFEKIVATYMSENQKLLDKFDLVAVPTIYFPKKQKVGIFCKVALSILKANGGMLDIRFFNKNNYGN